MDRSSAGSPPRPNRPIKVPSRAQDGRGRAPSEPPPEPLLRTLLDHHETLAALVDPSERVWYLNRSGCHLLDLDDTDAGASVAATRLLDAGRLITDEVLAAAAEGHPWHGVLVARPHPTLSVVLRSTVTSVDCDGDTYFTWVADVLPDWAAPSTLPTVDIAPAHEMEAELREAIGNPALSLHYQPQLDLTSGRIVAVEALSRWDHPRWGVVPPEQFIAVAEASSLIFDLGRWVMCEAFSRAAEWHAQLAPRQPVKVGVNVSVRQFSQPQFTDMVAEILDETGVTPRPSPSRSPRAWSCTTSTPP